MHSESSAIRCHRSKQLASGFRLPTLPGPLTPGFVRPAKSLVRYYPRTDLSHSCYKHSCPDLTFWPTISHPQCMDNFFFVSPALPWRATENAT